MDKTKLMIPGKWYTEFDENGNCTAAVYDASYRSLLGYESAEEYANARETWTSSIHPDDEERLNAYLADCLSKHPEGMDFDIEYRMMTKTGYHWFHDHATVTRREDGSVIRADGVLFDIQEGFDKVDIIKHQQLRTDVFAYIADHGDEDPIELLKTFAERIRVLIGCDQVIYRDLEETRIMVNSPAIEKTWSVPIEYCKQCEHFDAHHPMYSGGYTEMSNCQKGWQGIPVYKDCPIKSSLTRIVYCDDKIAGYLAIHYVQDYHEFTDVERTTLEVFTNILSVALSRYEAKKHAGETDSVKKMLNMLFSLSSEYDPIIVVEPESGEYDWYMSQADELTVNTSMTLHGDSLYKNIGIDGASIIHPDDRAQFQAFYTRENMMKIAETGEAQETENRWFLKLEDRYKWKYNKAVRMIDDDGKTYVVVGVIDTTEQKEKEDQLAQKTVLSNYFLKSYTAAYYADLTNKKLEILHIEDNDAVKIPENNAVKSGDLISFIVNNFVVPEDREKARMCFSGDYIRQRMEETDEFSFTFRVFYKNELRAYRCTVIPGNDEDHVAIGIQNITEDVKAQQERENQLQAAFDTANEANLRNDILYNIMNATRWSYDITADGKVAAARYGDRVIERTNITADDPMAWLDFVHPEDRERVAAEFAAAIGDHSGNTKYDATYRIFMKDGSVEWIKTSGRLMPHADGTAEMIGMTVNITEQMDYEREQQKQLAEALSMAESANRAKTTFLNNMSHDIRTPMNAIIGYTGLAASHIDSKQQVQDYLTKIAQSSDHLLSLINDVLDMSRIESGKMNLDERNENLPDIIHTLRDIVQSDIHSKQLDFFVDAVDVNDEDIICDKLRLNQVLLNILSNAIKYTPAGGTVTMRVTEKTVKPNGYAAYEFNIKDNGMGMDEDFLKTIFDPFTRVKSSTVSGIQGTGLGMAITKNIVDMMGGAISINSAPGRGTEVCVDFEFKLQSAPKAPEEIVELRGVRALVADDDSNTCLSICNMVRDIGMRFEWCTSGKEAVIRSEAAYHSGDSFKVYIIDWIMPDMNGIETTRRIRKVIGDEVPIIILTAYDWSDIEDEAREAGVTAFVSKPMFPSDLHKVLNKCLGKEPEQTAVDTESYDFSGRKILLVEDNLMNREIAVEILEEAGFIVEAVEDGDVAVDRMKYAKAGDYDLVLMDIQMPRMNGYEATREIRALDNEISRIPIIAMTANAFEEDRRLAMEAGMDEHIPKPIDIIKLKETLARFL